MKVKPERNVTAYPIKWLNFKKTGHSIYCHRCEVTAGKNIK